MPAPPAERLKVRCYRCNQLLAVSPAKAGTVVACPKCKADLLIPRQDAQQPGDDPADASVVALKSGTFPALAPVSASATATAGASGSASSSYLDEIAAVIPPELAALRPEDLRVEAEFFEKLSREPASAPAPSPTAEDPFQLPAEFLASDFLPPHPIDERSPDIAPSTAGFSTEVAVGGAGAVETPPPLPATAIATVPEPNVVVPPIQIETATIRPPVNAQARTIREVVLPASVVLAWLLFVLAAIPMAFIAGLMIGHFIWKTGP